MRTIPRAYEKGEFILIFYLPILVIVTFLINKVQGFSPVLTYNHGFLIETTLHLVLAAGLVLMLVDIKNVPEKRLKTTDWYIRIIVFLFLIGIVLGTLSILVYIAMKAFSNSPAFDFVRQHDSYGMRLIQLLHMAVMFTGAWIWLKGIRKGHAILAISGMVILMLLNSPGSYVESKFRQMKQQEMESITVTNEEASSEGALEGQNKDTEASNSRMRNDFPIGSDKIQGLWFLFRAPRLFGMALMLFTLVRYQKPKEQLE